MRRFPTLLVKHLIALVFSLTLLAPSALAQTAPSTPSPLVDRVGSTGFIQVEAESFKALDARHQALAYWLTQASIAIDPIIYDQQSRYGLRNKRLLEGIMSHLAGVDAASLPKITAFANCSGRIATTTTRIRRRSFSPTLPSTS